MQARCRHCAKFSPVALRNFRPRVRSLTPRAAAQRAGGSWTSGWRRNASHSCRRAGSAGSALAAPALHAQGGRIGYIDLPACAALLGGSLPAIALARRATARVPDRAHSVAYVTLLVTVLLVMGI
ncbi:hypothetical protein OG802_34415 [Streptomyces sp. NBC_00704]|uniref:hypothetical protein n=1 Tax=Streptomyces sp. NBC_00704 TaxID=2975809 RepID=UPI002E2F4818|nr:hypothetical protein [Streptomyces sp. NBC_00704]